MCGAGPGDLGEVSGVGLGRNSRENRVKNLQPDAELIEKLAHCCGLNSREIGSLLLTEFMNSFILTEFINSFI